MIPQVGCHAAVAVAVAAAQDVIVVQVDGLVFDHNVVVVVDAGGAAVQIVVESAGHHRVAGCPAPAIVLLVLLVALGVAAGGCVATAAVAVVDGGNIHKELGHFAAGSIVIPRRFSAWLLLSPSLSSALSLSLFAPCIYLLYIFYKYADSVRFASVGNRWHYIVAYF